MFYFIFIIKFSDKKAADKDLAYLKENREEARNKRSMLDTKISMLDELQQKMNKIDNDLKPLVNRYNDILYIEQNLSLLQNSLLSSKGRLKSIILAQQELQLVIKVQFEGDDFQIDDALENFNKNLA